MAYQVTAPHGVFVLLPTGMTRGNRQISQNVSIPQGATLPDGVKPEAIAALLGHGMIEEVAD